MVYQQRLLLYCDILGWSAEISTGDPSRLLTAVECIHSRAEEYNEQERQKLLAQDGEIVQTEMGQDRAQINRGWLQIQYGAFSDHFVFSLPESFGSRILSTASKLIIELLRIGFLVRGAIVLGPLHHRDNVVFGPALLQAVNIEENEAFYPRILVTDAVVDHCSKLPHDPRHKSMLLDRAGRWVVNPFAMPFDGPDEAIESFVSLNFFFPEIRPLIEQQIDNLEKAHRHQHAEKWRYLHQFVAGPVLDAAPKLRRFWERAGKASKS
jgi:hypothetical protein